MFFTKTLQIVLLISLKMSLAEDILMVTMGGTKSHKLPFLELGRGLKARGHNVTLLSAFPGDHDSPVEEISPLGFVLYVRNFTNWDILGPRLRGEEPVPVLHAFRYGYQACESLLTAPETRMLLSRHFRLLILDGAYPECAVGLAHHYGAPFIFLNTVGFYTQSLAIAGNPAPYSVTPYLGLAHSDLMTLWERTVNAGWHTALSIGHWAMVRGFLDPIVRKHLGGNIPPAYAIARNVSFVLQNGHFSVTYPRAYLPGVAEVACLHCKQAKPLPQDLEDFVSGGRNMGFVYVSMGSSVKAMNMPEYLRHMMVSVFSQLPYQVLWKWEADPDTMPDLPSNVRLGRWLPQQDLLGHGKILAFVNHGGLLSLFESVYHGVPVVALPVFCDHDSNSHKAERDGYALRLELRDLTADTLLAAINKVIRDPKYKDNVRLRSRLLRDQPETPLNRSLYWIEYVLRHRGAYHLHSPAKDLNVFQYFMLDALALVLALAYLTIYTAKVSMYLYRTRLSKYLLDEKVKLE